MGSKEEYEARKAERQKLIDAAEILEDETTKAGLEIMEVMDRIATALEQIAVNTTPVNISGFNKPGDIEFDE